MPDSRGQQFDDRIIRADINQIFLRTVLMSFNQCAEIIVDYPFHLILMNWTKHSIKHVIHPL
jgi:hypothetical protein